MVITSQGGVAAAGPRTRQRVRCETVEGGRRAHAHGERVPTRGTLTPITSDGCAAGLQASSEAILGRRWDTSWLNRDAYNVVGVFGRWQREIHRRVFESGNIDAGGVRQRDRLLLPGLPEDDSMGHELTLQALERLDLRGVRRSRHMPLHPVFTLATQCGASPARAPRPQGGESMGGSEVPVDGMTLVAVNPRLALVQVHRIARQVPVDQAVAPGMEVETLLPYRRAG